MTLHTPYDGSSRLFQIGIKPLDPGNWLDIDDRFVDQLAAKRHILATYPDDTFVAEAGTEDAQAELRDMLADHLPRHFPHLYRRENSGITILPSGETVPLNGDAPPLLAASRLVADDLVILRKGQTGWRLVAAVLAFPSSWVLREKFGRPIHDIHAPVPGFGAGTRPAQLIERMFDMMRPETPMIRWNWSIYGDDRLYHPDTSPPDRPRFDADLSNVFLRVERQTLRRLPKSGDIAFTIGISLDPLKALEAQPDAAAIAGALADQLMALDPAQLDYKGITLDRNRLVERLRRI